jgi:hypothetical protein
MRWISWASADARFGNDGDWTRRQRQERLLDGNSGRRGKAHARPSATPKLQFVASGPPRPRATRAAMVHCRHCHSIEHSFTGTAANPPDLWNLAPLYADDAAWEAARQKLLRPAPPACWRR